MSSWQVPSHRNYNQVQVLCIHVQETKIKSLKATVEKGFRSTDGPFVKGLDNALKSFNVHREQYYGGIFVGNHIHRTLQVQNTFKYLFQYTNIRAIHHQCNCLHIYSQQTWKHFASVLFKLLHKAMSQLCPMRPKLCTISSSQSSPSLLNAISSTTKSLSLRKKQQNQVSYICTYTHVHS